MRQLKISHKITSRESAALEKYLSEISKIDLVTADEEVVLAQKIRAGDKAALERLTSANLRFVVSVAKQYQNQGLSLSDLINEGNVGLMKAAKRFDESKGFKFISYAVWWIRQSILQAIVEYSRLVRMPQNKASSYSKINAAVLSFQQEFEREPSDEELADILGVKVSDIRRVRAGAKRHVALDAPMNGEEGDSTMLDLMTVDGIAPDNSLMEESLKDEVQEGLSILTPREIEVLSAFYGLNGRPALKLEDIGDQYGLTRERVRQIKERAIRRLRKSYNRNQLKSYLG